MAVYTEWRTISEFPNYEINMQGEVRNRSTFKFLDPTRDANTTYQFIKNKDVYVIRMDNLMKTAFPELH